jgi:PAS domain S-box-containing protein
VTLPSPAVPADRRAGLSVRATLAVLAATGTTAIVLLSLLLGLTIMRPATRVRQSIEPVIYLVDALGEQAQALDNALLGVRRIVSGNGVTDRLRLSSLRSRLATLTDRGKLRGYDKVPSAIRSELAGAEADITRLQDRLVEVLDLVEMGRLDAARQRVLIADSLQLTVRNGLSVAQRARAADLVLHEEALGRSAKLAMWEAALIAAAALGLSALNLVIVRRRIDRPLVELSTALDRARHGDLSTALPVRRPDEMGRLAEHFNAMTRVMADVRRRDEEALRRSESSYRELVEKARYGIYRSTRSGRFLMVNSALVALLGYDSAEQVLELDIGRDVYADPAERERLIREAPGLAEVTWKRRDGKAIIVLLASQGVAGPNGEIEGFEAIVEDLTERRSLEVQLRQAQKMEAVGRLAGGIAHDFNNILTAIIGYSEMLFEELDAGDAKRRRVEEIRAAAERAAALTGQLLAFSRKQVLQARVLDLNVVVRGLETMLRRLLGEDVKLEVSRGAELGAVRADRGQLEQVIMNLAVNARDAMPQGGRLTLETANVVLDETYARAHEGASAGRYVLLAVSDTGAGMDAETRSHIFEPFFTTKEQGQGTGLGLSMVYGIVKQSGGYVSVYSEPGRGSTFKLYFPRVDARVEAPDLLPARPTAKGGRETVLVAEDDAAVREVVSTALKDKGYHLLEAPDGQAALEIARAQAGEIPLLVTDLVMPGMTGRDLADALVAERPTMRVLYMSGYTDDAVVRHGVLEQGMPYLQKPFTPNALALKVRQVLDRT